MIKTGDKIRAEVEAFGVDDVAPGLAAVVLSLADTLDETEAPTARAVVARELMAALKVLRALAPPAVKGDAVDDIAEQRAKRRADARGQAADG